MPDIQMSTVIQLDNPREHSDHPTEKPQALWMQLARWYAGDVFDPFLGSGTTLIAAEQLGRRCYGMEIEPIYCDVIVRRWENLTGEKATRHG